MRLFQYLFVPGQIIFINCEIGGIGKQECNVHCSDAIDATADFKLQSKHTC